MVQPPLTFTTPPRSKPTPERRKSLTGLPSMARESVAPSTYRVGVPRDDPPGPCSLVPSRAVARTRYNRQTPLPVTIFRANSDGSDKIEVAGCGNPSADSTRPYMQRLMGTNSLGASDIELITAA
jgi:hypothetical protein